jgi:NAD+ synthase (glutamine-hydrolysing)
MQTLRIALAQINCTVGDLNGNTVKIKENIARAREVGAHIVVLPELAICGYPPEDLLFKPSFLHDCRAALDECARESLGIISVVGFPDAKEDTYNAAAVCANGQVASIYHKQYLPNYGVFDENRYFQQGTVPSVFKFPLAGTHSDGDAIIGVNVCEDMWYPDGPLRDQALVGDAELIINISASPYHRGKGHFRAQMLGTRAADHVCIVAFCNLVGGQDELIFDGQSMIFDQHGDLIVRGQQFEEDFVVADSTSPRSSVSVCTTRAAAKPSSRYLKKNASLTVARCPPPPLPSIPPCNLPSRTAAPCPAPSRKFTGRWCWARAITSARMASTRYSLDCRAASIRRWSRLLPPMP